MANLIGQRLGQYEITDLIGEGGMAVVYQARQLNVQRHVAVKVIKHGLVSPAKLGEFLRRFKREADLVASLSHPHILKLFDYGQHEDLVYFVMELMPGGSLAQLMANKPFIDEQAARYLDQIASALDYAHGESVIHRDLKPQNILLDKQGNAILSDFGIARFMNADATKLTASGIIMGTPTYMAPEQWQSREVDSRTDLYALGVMVYEMLAGQPPHNGDTPFQLMHAHVYDPLPSIRRIRPDLPKSVEVVLEKALAKTPDYRFQSGEAFAQAFRTALTGVVPSGMEEAPTTGPQVIPVPPQPHPATPATEEQLTPRPQQSVSRVGLLTLGAFAIIAVLVVVALSLSSDGRNTGPTETPELITLPSETPGIVAVLLSETPTDAPSETPAPTKIPTNTSTGTQTPTSTSTETPPNTPTETSTVTQLPVHTDTVTFTASPNLETLVAQIAVERGTSTANAAASLTWTFTPSSTHTMVPTDTPDLAQTVVFALNATDTAVAVASWTKTPTATLILTQTATLPPTEVAYVPGPPVDPFQLMDAAIADLGERLGRNIVDAPGLQSEWVQEVFADGSLGCPQAGETYAQVTTNGYVITVSVSGAVYDYRATADGAVLFLCGLRDEQGAPQPLNEQPAYGSVMGTADDKDVLTPTLTAPVPGPPADPFQLAEAAIADLEGRLGRNIADAPELQYEWMQMEFADSSLGCPQVGETYADATPNGYIIALTVNGAVYDYRATADGGILFLCGLRDAQGTPQPLTEQSDTAPTRVTANAQWTPVIQAFDGVDMVQVPAGCFMMGGNESDEQPVHSVCFDQPFWIDRTEVTNAQFAQLGGQVGRASNWTNADHPRERITWFEAQDFCARRGTRLPTEAEWEYAARGPDGLTYPWGNTFDGTRFNSCDRNCVSDWRDSSISDDHANTAPVGSYAVGASWVGALDMSGNVGEWVNDWFGAYDGAPTKNPAGPSTGGVRVVRGGSWADPPNVVRASDRAAIRPDNWVTTVGFRCARSS